MGHPLVVDLGAVQPEDVVLDPVGAGPARGVSGLESDAPRLVVALGGDLVGQCRQVIEGLGDLVPLLLELGDRTRRSP